MGSEMCIRDSPSSAWLSSFEKVGMLAVILPAYGLRLACSVKVPGCFLRASTRVHRAGRNNRVSTVPTLSLIHI